MASMRSRRRTTTVPFSWQRRNLMAAMGSMSLWPFLTPSPAQGAQDVHFSGNPFTLGVASGDPTPDGIVLWTRLALDPLHGGGMPNEPIPVRWEIADDEAMKNIVAHGTEIATPALAHSVHVEVAGLKPGKWYFYRFNAGGVESKIGRTRTAPRLSDTPERLRFAFASCQHYEQGYFTAYDYMAREDLDVIVHLGDYLYEYEGKEKQVRKHVGGKLDSLEDYRNRHALYKTDPSLQSAHRLFPWIVAWDDHEFENNCAGPISEREDADPSKFLEQRGRAYQAYYEHMPLRRTQLPKGPDMLMYRQLPFGQLLDFLVLDTRQYRSDQPCGDGNKVPCSQCFDPNATMLGKEQEHWLFSKLQTSSQIWNVLAQQVMMARVDRQEGHEIKYSMDQWPGYEISRQRVLEFFRDQKPSNPIVLTGDIHSNFCNELQVNEQEPNDPSVAVEFVGTSISSGGDGKVSGKKRSKLEAENPMIKYFNAQRGYVSCEVTPQEWTTHYRVLDYVTKPGSPMKTSISFVVESGRSTANEV